MEIAPRVEVRQKLSLTPEMRHRLQVLGMNALELRDRIEQEVTDNPALELEEFGPEEAEQVEADELGLSDEHAAALAEWDEDLASAEEHGDWSVPGEERVTPLDIARTEATFEDYLTRQLGESALSSAVARAAKAIVLSLDDAGYFRGDLADIAGQAQSTPAEAEAALRAVQSLDPPGVGARDLKECLTIQLAEQGPEADLARRIVDDHLDQLAAGKRAAIARALHVSSDEVAQAMGRILRLNPHPANAYGEAVERNVVVPEFEVRDMGGELVVLPISEATPTMRINQMYASMLRSGSGDEATLDYLRGRLRAARRFVRDVERRKDTLHAVALSAVRAQGEFFKSPDGELVPLRLEQVATELGLHPSTISRAVSGKYLSSPRGVIELRRLFSGGLPGTDGSIAVESVRRRLRDLVAAEPSDAPFSDARLAELLKAQGLDISRRTVAKYREQSGIAPSWKRKRI